MKVGALMEDASFSSYKSGSATDEHNGQRKTIYLIYGLVSAKQ